MRMQSHISGFYKLPIKERQQIVGKIANLSAQQTQMLASGCALSLEMADKISENVIGVHCLPFSVATNFVVNGKEVLVPMCIEEPSVVAAASYAAKLCKESGGFSASADPPVMIGQIQLVGMKDAQRVAELLNSSKQKVLEAASPFAKSIEARNGGVRNFAARVLETKRGQMVIAEFHIDVRDAMGANIVNTILEGVSPAIEEIAGASARLRILSNLSVLRLARATAIWKKEAIGGEKTVDAILDAWAFAEADIFRAATHNKGIMNGIDAVALATGNDWRAIEAGAHAYASIGGKYLPLTRYRKLKNGDLQGEIELPLAAGTVGGAIRSLPTAGLALAIMKVKSSVELACIMASVGLAQNFAALRALVTEGIQKGHMELHARNVAIAAGAKGEQIEQVAKKMAEEKNITEKRARELIAELEAGGYERRS
ncbi:MAG: hydroxymethylglutaryl-CoA reductase, degradative [Candidatus Micrarchaeota archaeon]|nr:hydroxymethylglutaryl-CoA reductase, degradative [Candidatus Micrarchaeota archaeon]